MIALLLCPKKGLQRRKDGDTIQIYQRYCLVCAKDLIEIDGTVKDGQRYILGFDIPKSRERHVIIAFREKGELKLYDPQNGETYRGRAIWSYLSDKSKLRLTRVDDLEFNPEVINYVVKEVK